jgi:hypothetical protein
LDHSLGSKNLGTLIVSKRGLTAHIDHGLDTSGITDQARRGIKRFRSWQCRNALVNVTRSNGKDINWVSSGKETGHIQIMNGHVGKDTTATFDVSKRRWRGITRAQFDLSNQKIKMGQH